MADEPEKHKLGSRRMQAPEDSQPEKSRGTQVGSPSGAQVGPLSSGQIGSLVLAGVALLCVAVGQPYAAATFVFVSIVALFSGRKSGGAGDKSDD